MRAMAWRWICVVMTLAAMAWGQDDSTVRKALREQGGLGIIFGKKGEEVVVKELVYHGPGDEAGIRIGWQLLSFNDQSVAGLTFEAAAQKIRTQPGASVKLGFRDPLSGKIISREVVRRKYQYFRSFAELPGEMEEVRTKSKVRVQRLSAREYHIYNDEFRVLLMAMDPADGSAPYFGNAVVFDGKRHPPAFYLAYIDGPHLRLDRVTAVMESGEHQVDPELRSGYHLRALVR